MHYRKRSDQDERSTSPIRCGMGPVRGSQALLNVLCLLLISLLATAAEFPRPGPFEELVTKVVAKTMTHRHYQQHTLDDEISQAVFEAYLRVLDSDRVYFTKSDIDRFSKYRNVLDDLLHMGEIDFPFEVFHCFLERLRERTVYMETRIKEPFDFTADEEIRIDRSTEPWAESGTQMNEIWRRRIKNECLRRIIRQERRRPSGTANDKDNPETSSGRDAEMDKQDTSTPTTVPDEIAADVLRGQRRYLHRQEQKNTMDVLEQFLSTFARVFDPHSTYMAPVTRQNFDLNMKLSLEGIGAMLDIRGRHVSIVNVIPGGPARRDGRLKTGDRIVAVAQDGEDPVDVVDMPMRRVVGLIRGPKGTRVFLHVIDRDEDLDSDPTIIDIVRDTVRINRNEAKSWTRSHTSPPVARPVRDGEPYPTSPAVSKKSTNLTDIFELPEPTAATREGPEVAAAARPDSSDFLVVSLPVFYSDYTAEEAGDPDYKSTTRDVRQLIEERGAENIAGLILDLRSNHGGSMQEAVSLVGLFIAAGPVVQVLNPKVRPKVHRDDDGVVHYAGPLLVLVNSHSASSSEIVAGAVQDYHRGIIVGERSTHGKGTVQTISPIAKIVRTLPAFRKQDPGTLKFTIGKFYRVTGESTQLKGVTPDIVLPSYRDHQDIGEAFLSHALPFDTIAPVPADCDVDVRPFIPTIQKRCRERLKKDQRYVQLQRDIERFGERQEKTHVPLEIGKRREYMDDTEKWNRTIRRSTSAERSHGDDDLVMNQAMWILHDLITLHNSGIDALGDPSEVVE